LGYETDRPRPLTSSVIIDAQSLGLQYRYAVVRDGAQINVWLSDRATVADILRAYVHASLLARLLADDVCGTAMLEQYCAAAVDAVFPLLWHELGAAGWALDHVFLAERAVRLRLV